MSYTVGRGTEIPDEVANGERPGEKLSLGVAARLSRYLQVLTQARKMGKETISSQELADYTHVNSLSSSESSSARTKSRTKSSSK